MATWFPREEPAIRIDTLGRLAIVPAGRQPTVGLPPVRSALLVFLAIERDVAREEALALFWPESGDRQARHSLNQVLHRLRADLGGGWVRVSGDRLQATHALHSDVHEFMAAIEAGELDRALALYGGRFLQGASPRGQQTLRGVGRPVGDTPGGPVPRHLSHDDRTRRGVRRPGIGAGRSPSLGNGGALRRGGASPGHGAAGGFRQRGGGPGAFRLVPAVPGG
jgi:hypothetical protein